MSLRLLAVGDIHLGRRPGGLPDNLSDSLGLAARAVGPEAALQATVEEALARKVHAVLLLGDVVDGAKHYLPSWSLLRSQVDRLIEAGIRVVAVAGNHDVHVLPRLAKEVNGLRLLGAGGTWERLPLTFGEHGGIDLLGWSYPEQHPRRDPCDDPELSRHLARDEGRAVLGLLHGELDAGGSDYARFTRARLASTRVAAWLLGHIHKPDFVLAGPGEVSMGYLGSLTGLDRTETGGHGPWLLSIEGNRLTAAEQLPLAPLRWEQLNVSVEELDDPARVDDLLIGAMRDFESDESRKLGKARLVGLNVTFTGQHRQSKALRPEIAALERTVSQFATTLGGRQAFVASVQDAIRPAVDLHALAKGGDPPGLLARRLLELQGASLDTQATERRTALLRAAQRSLNEVARRTVFKAIEPKPPTDADLSALLLEAGLRVVEELLAHSPQHRSGAT